MEILTAIGLLIGAFGLAVLPTMISVNRDTERKLGIFVCNIIGLVTGIFWVVALIWACAESKKRF